MSFSLRLSAKHRHHLMSIRKHRYTTRGRGTSISTLSPLPSLFCLLKSPNRTKARTMHRWENQKGAAEAEVGACRIPPDSVCRCNHGECIPIAEEPSNMKSKRLDVMVLSAPVSRNESDAAKPHRILSMLKKINAEISESKAKTSSINLGAQPINCSRSRGQSSYHPPPPLPSTAPPPWNDSVSSYLQAPSPPTLPSLSPPSLPRSLRLPSRHKLSSTGSPRIAPISITCVYPPCSLNETSHNSQSQLSCMSEFHFKEKYISVAATAIQTNAIALHVPGDHNDSIFLEVNDSKSLYHSESSCNNSSSCKKWAKDHQQEVVLPSQSSSPKPYHTSSLPHDKERCIDPKFQMVLRLHV